MKNNLGFIEAKTTYEKISDCHGILTVEPLERGFGLTIGNSLRRIMLSSLPGSAISKVKFDGVSHEFSSIPDVKEEVPEIIMNLKSLAIRSIKDEDVTVRCDFVGPGVIKASDIKLPEGVEIINKDQVIATLSQSSTNKGTTLGMDLTISNGRGYDGANTRVAQRNPGEIFVDALYTPIARVNMKVENTRVGQAVDWDKVILDIFTNGTMSPDDAVSLAAKVLTEHLKLIENLSEETQNAEIMEKKVVEQEVKTEDDRPLESLGLHTRSENALRRFGIETVGDLTQLTYAELSKIRNLGAKSVKEIVESLEDNGYSLSNGEN